MTASYDVFQREDGFFQISLADDAPCFPTRQFALTIASGEKPAAVNNVVGGKFRRFRVVREALHA